MIIKECKIKIRVLTQLHEREKGRKFQRWQSLKMSNRSFPSRLQVHSVDLCITRLLPTILGTEPDTGVRAFEQDRYRSPRATASGLAGEMGHKMSVSCTARVWDMRGNRCKRGDLTWPPSWPLKAEFRSLHSTSMPSYTTRSVQHGAHSDGNLGRKASVYLEKNRARTRRYSCVPGHLPVHVSSETGF